MKTERSEKERLLSFLNESSPLDPGFESAQEELEEILNKEAERVIFRSKVKWVEENEKSTKFFYMRIKSNRGKSNIEKLMINDTEIDDAKILEDEVRGFYKNLYSSKHHSKTELEQMALLIPCCFTGVN